MSGVNSTLPYSTTNSMHGTTIIAVRRGDGLALAADGQVTLGNTVMKNSANKVRRLYRGSILSGFAGSVADAVTLYEKMEKKLEECSGELIRASVELAREWRSDKYLRKLEAMLIVANLEKILLLSGTGEVIEPDDSILAIGSGGEFARSAALALLENTELSAEKIAKKSLGIAGKICIYTNLHIRVETIKG